MAESRVTQVGAYIEVGGQLVRVTQVGGYFELQAVVGKVTALGAYVEIGQFQARASLAGLYVELARSLDFYAVGDGHDLDVSFLTALDPQPLCQGIRITRRIPSQSQEAHQDDALHLVYEYSALGGESEYTNLLYTWGLLDAIEADVTVTAKDQNRAWQRWSGTAVRPAMGDDVKWHDYFPRDINIFVKGVRLAT